MGGELALLALQLLGAASPPSAAPVEERQAVTVVGRVQEEDLLLLAVVLDAATLTESLSAYGETQDPLLPVGEIARLLDLNVLASPSQNTITGDLGEAQRPLTVDLSQGLARSGGKNIRVQADDAGISAHDIYLKASLLEQLLPVKFKIDAEALLLTITATEKLPIQERAERQSRLANLRPEDGPSEPILQVASPYEVFTPPALDIIIEAGRDTRGNRFPRRYDLRFAGDLLHMGYQGFVGSDQAGNPDNARFLLERRSSGGNLLGPIGATYLGAGDVFTPSLSVGPRSGSGRGFSFSTGKPGDASVFQKITLRGELPLGYDVELYINDVLRSGQRSAVEGRYEFIDVPLVRGLNVIRVVTYGPRGERSEQTRVLNVGGGQLATGEAAADFGIVQQDRSLVNFGKASEDRRADRGELRAVASVAYGLSEAVTLVAGAALYPDTSGRRHELMTAGARGSLLGIAVQADAAATISGGSAYSLGLAGQHFGIAATVRHNEYRGSFVDETLTVYSLGRPLARHSEANVDFSLSLGKQKFLPLSARLEREGYRDGGHSWLAIGRGSTTVSDVLVSAGLNYFRDARPGGRVDTLFGGNVAASTFIDYKWQLRGVLDYSILPQRSFRALEVSANRQLSEMLGAQFGLGRTFGENKDLFVQAGLNFRLPFADAAITGDYANAKKDWRIGLRLAFGLGYNPLAGGYRLLRPGVAAGGSAAFHAFLDNNGNGFLEAGEEPVSGVVIEGGEGKVSTDARGRAFLSGLGNSVSRRLRANVDEIESAYVTPPPANIEFAPRPGKVVKIPYPLAPVGEVDARLELNRDGEMVGVSAVRVRLSGDGVGPIEGMTEYDGSVFFDKVRPGTYRFELDPEQAARLRMRLANEVEVRVTADGSERIRAEVIFDQPE